MLTAEALPVLFNDVLACVEQVRHPGAGIDIGNGRRIFGQLFADDGLLSTEHDWRLCCAGRMPRCT